MNWHDYDMVVAGGGIAGSLLTDQLIQRGTRVLQVAAPDAHCASQIGAGIMNPISGRRYLLAWRYRELSELALTTYRNLEAATGKKLLGELSLLKALFHPGDQNEWLLRCADPDYVFYMRESIPAALTLPWTEVFATGMVAPVWRLDMAGVTEAVRQLHGPLMEGRVRDDRILELHGESVQIPDHLPLILTTGTGLPRYGDTKFPLNPYKGEALIITSADLPENYVLHHRLHIIPLGAQHFWVGAYNRWDFESPTPSPAGYQWLVENLEKTFPIQYHVERHIAGVRPSSERRRPFVGPVPGVINTWTLNGLGTKGASLAPYLCNQLVHHLLHGTALDPEITWPWKKPTANH